MSEEKEFTHKFGARPKRKMLDYTILKGLTEKPMYGYEIRKYLSKITGGRWIPSFSMIYPVLKEFLENGLVTREEVKKGDRVRYIYHITEEGRKQLDECKGEIKKYLVNIINVLGEKHTKFFLIFLLDNDMFKDMFEELPKDVKIKLLKQMETQLEDYLSKVRGYLKKLENE